MLKIQNNHAWPGTHHRVDNSDRRCTIKLAIAYTRYPQIWQPVSHNVAESINSLKPPANQKNRSVLARTTVEQGIKIVVNDARPPAHAKRRPAVN